MVVAGAVVVAEVRVCVAVEVRVCVAVVGPVTVVRKRLVAM